MRDARASQREPVAGGVMVLIVEDEVVSRRALLGLLRLNGFKTKAVGSAEDGLRLILNGEVPDVAVVDVNLPGMSGIEFIRRVRRLHPLLPCIFMSANEEVNLEQIREAFRQPALRKPFDVSSLLHLLRLAPLAHSTSAWPES
jgi:CheY-like chemotaxis protein